MGPTKEFGSRPVSPVRLTAPDAGSTINGAAEALFRENTVWLPERLPAAFWAPPKTHKRPTFPLVTMVGRDGLEPPTPCASWTSGASSDVRRCSPALLVQGIWPSRCTAVHLRRLAWLSTWLSGTSAAVDPPRHCPRQTLEFSELSEAHAQSVEGIVKTGTDRHQFLLNLRIGLS